MNSGRKMYTESSHPRANSASGDQAMLCVDSARVDSVMDSSAMLLLLDGPAMIVEWRGGGRLILIAYYWDKSQEGPTRAVEVLGLDGFWLMCEKKHDGRPDVC